MKVYNLCGAGTCPRVIFNDDGVKIGEKENICTLRKEEWNELVKGVQKGKPTTIK